MGGGDLLLLLRDQRWRKKEEMEELSFSSSFIAVEECLMKKKEMEEISFSSSFITTEECLLKKEEMEEEGGDDV